MTDDTLPPNARTWRMKAIGDQLIAAISHGDLDTIDVVMAALWRDYPEIAQVLHDDAGEHLKRLEEGKS